MESSPRRHHVVSTMPGSGLARVLSCLRAQYMWPHTVKLVTSAGVRPRASQLFLAAMSPLWIPSRQAAADVVHLGVSQGDRAWSVSAQRTGFFFLVLSCHPLYCALVLLSIHP